MTSSQATANVCKYPLTTESTASNVNGKTIYLQNVDCTIRSQVSLAGYTSYRVGGRAELLVCPRSVEALLASVEYARGQGLPLTVLGAGSNLLVSDRGIPGLVIAMRHLRHRKFDNNTGQLTVSAGESIPALAWEAAQRGWSGFEWLVGIPGTVGGAVVMNAGAHRSCTADSLVSVEVLSPDGTLLTLHKHQLNYSYRSSVLQGSNLIVVQATFALQPGADPAQVIVRTKQHKQHRLNTQPYHLPSCGSVFRNPQPYGAGWLIEQTGLKGYRIGQAQVSELHANFIVNRGGAKANDILNLIRYVQHQVQEKWSMQLHPEVKMLGDFEVA